ncbi:MAG: alpha/beta fold hydrolase [Deltaproteobacteria bacterium]|nr:alpha/beta fold hydrolase [Deltaproteobacteria bacterium]
MPTPLPDRSAEPFDLLPAGRAEAPAALCVHGFSGSPYEVLPLAHHLRAEGWRAVGPLLPGHGRTPLELARTTGTDLLEGARAALWRLHAQEGPVTWVGLSTGALLGLILAAAHPEMIRALVLLAPALGLYPKARLGMALARRGLARLVPYVPKEAEGGDCGDPDGRAHNPTYPVIPVAALPALGELQQAAAAALSVVRAPAFVGHGALDGTIPPVCGRRVAEGLARAPAVESRVYARTRHLVLLDVERDAVMADVSAFLTRVGAAARLTGAGS